MATSLANLDQLTIHADPLMDLGNTLAYWIEAADPAPVQLMPNN